METPSASVTLKGVLERIVYANEENHYTIGDLRPEGLSHVVTICGKLPGVQCGETLELDGEWTRHPVHGDQFRVKNFRATLPASVYGIQKYLGSGLIPKVGPKFAEKIVAKFGEDTLRVISEESGRLREIPGVGKKRAKEIKAAWDEQHSLRDLMVFLQTHGVGTALSVKLIRQYGAEAKTILQHDPYRVAREIPGIGFRTADRIAVNVGFHNESPPRLAAGLLFALQDLETKGHTCFPEDALVQHAAALLEVPEEKLAVQLQSLAEHGSIHRLEPQHPHWPDTFERLQRVLEKDRQIDSGEAPRPRGAAPGIIQLSHLKRAEHTIAETIRLLESNPSGLPPIQVERAIQWAQDKAGFEFAPEQANGVRAALHRKVSILTGGPGTGKTTILRAVVDILRAKKVRILLAAPTGRAAQRMTEATGCFAQTVHRLLKFDAAAGKFSVNAENPLRTDFVIADESSMLDTRLAAALFRAIPSGSHLLLVGDVHQLPSVGSGNVLADIIHCFESAASAHEGEVPAVVRLETVFRQKKRSGIVHVAHGILEGAAAAPFLAEAFDAVDPKNDFHFLRADTPEKTVTCVTQLLKEYLPRWYPKLHPIRDVQVLGPMHRGTCGIQALNETLQHALNPDKPGVQSGNERFQVGDKVIQTRNNYDKGIFNGDLGIVSAVNPEAGAVAVQFDDEEVEFDRQDIGELHLAYAFTIHKSQGSEFPIVVVPLQKQHFMMLQRNLIYTAITRGRRKVFLVGDPVAYAMAVRNKEASIRLTYLPDQLMQQA